MDARPVCRTQPGERVGSVARNTFPLPSHTTATKSELHKKSILQWGLIGTFVCLALFVFVPSFYVLSSNSDSPGAPPKTPEPPSADKLNDATVKAYVQEVAAYQAAVTAYNAQMQALGKSNRLATYQVVVKDTLVAYFGATLASLIAFAFVSGATQVRDNSNRMRNRQAPKDIAFFD